MLAFAQPLACKQSGMAISSDCLCMLAVQMCPQICTHRCNFRLHLGFVPCEYLTSLINYWTVTHVHPDKLQCHSKGVKLTSGMESQHAILSHVNSKPMRLYNLQTMSRHPACLTKLQVVCRQLHQLLEQHQFVCRVRTCTASLQVQHCFS